MSAHPPGRSFPAAGVMDPRHLRKLRRAAADAEAREQVTRDLGEPRTPEERKRFDREVGRRVEEWMKGWDGAGLHLGGGMPPVPWRRRWWRRGRRDEPGPGSGG